MRTAVVIMILALAGCGTGQSGFSGKHAKNGGPERVERLGVLTTSELPAERQCGAKQVRWCADRGDGAACACIPVQQATDRVRRLARQLQQQSIQR